MTAPAVSIPKRRGRKPNWSLVTGLLLVGACAAVAALAHVLAPFAPTRMSFGSELVGPSMAHFFGTDELGRDIFSRVLFGMRSSFMVVVPAAVVASITGVAIGLTLGYAGGTLDTVLMRVFDILMAFPTLILAIVMLAFLGPNTANLILSLALLSVSNFVVLTRSMTLAARENEYVQAAIALGARAPRVMFKHVLRNIAPAITTQVALSLSVLILVEASLAFLGIGVQPPTPSLGGMLNSAQTYMTIAPWLALGPGLTIMAVVIGFNLLADGIRDLTSRGPA